MKGLVLTERDIEWLREHLARRIENHERCTDDPEYDEGGPEPVMTSIGYVDLWIDGDACAHGAILANIADRPALRVACFMSAPDCGPV